MGKISWTRAGRGGRGKAYILEAPDFVLGGLRVGACAHSPRARPREARGRQWVGERMPGARLGSRAADDGDSSPLRESDEGGGAHPCD